MPPPTHSSPPPLVRDTHQMRWLIAAPWEQAVLDADGLRLNEWLAQNQARVVKRSPGRTIYRVDLPARCLFVKHYRGDWRDRLRQWFRASAAQREWLKTLELERRNVPTVRPIALGEPRGRAWNREQFFLTEAVPGGVPLGEVLAAATPQSDSPHWRRKLLAELARLVAAAHREGVLHDDLHAGNILVAGDNLIEPRLYLIDLPKVRFTRPLDWPTSRDNLAMLYSGHLGQFPRTELAQFWSIYRASRPELNIADANRAGRELIERTWTHARRIARDRDRRPLRENREFYHRQTRAGLGYAVREVPPATLQHAIANPAELLVEALDRPLKLTHGSVVVQTELPWETGSIGIAYKRYRPKTWWKRFLALWRPSRAQQSWVQGHALLARGIATPRPLLACALPRWRAAGVSYLATTWIPGAMNLHLYAWGLRELDAAQRVARTRRAARSLGALVGRMHAWNIAHHDLKGCNLLLADRGDEVDAYVIDLDGIRRHRRLPNRAPVESLARLEASAQAHPWLGQTDRLRFLLAYLRQSPGVRPEWKPLWRAVARRSEQIATRLRREGTLA